MAPKQANSLTSPEVAMIQAALELPAEDRRSTLNETTVEDLRKICVYMGIAKWGLKSAIVDRIMTKSFKPRRSLQKAAKGATDPRSQALQQLLFAQRLPQQKTSS